MTKDDVATYGPMGRTGPKDCPHSMQDWYVKNDSELGCSECDEARARPMKPHEEQGWRANDRHVDSGDRDEVAECHCRQPTSADPASSVEYAKRTALLIAAAPAMARLLLKMQWLSQEAEDGSLPPQCMLCEAYEESTDHAPDCELMAVLRKAGVVE